MRKIICDRCETDADVGSNLMLPAGWSEVKINATLAEKLSDSGFARTKRQVVTRNYCNKCINKMFDFEQDAEPNLKEQFEQATLNWIEDLAIDAVEAAQDNI